MIGFRVPLLATNCQAFLTHGKLQIGPGQALEFAKEMIHDTVERPDLTLAEKSAVLGLNAKNFFRV